MLHVSPHKVVKGKEAIEFLKPVQLFSSLSNNEIDQISGKVKIKRFKKNEIILYEEDTNTYMYIILFGKVKAVQITKEGKETTLAMHRSGEFFGEMSLIDGKTVPATVIATEDTLTAIIPKKDFYTLLFTQEKILKRLLEIMCSRLRKSWDMIQLLNFKNAAQRLKMLFSILSEEYGKKTPEGITLGIKLTHRDMANMAGITRETVTRVIDRWQKEKEITVLKNKFIRLNPNFLQRDLKEEM
jgi:CRP/FNR family transcriptional regulator